MDLVLRVAARRPSRALNSGRTYPRRLGNGIGCGFEMTALLIAGPALAGERPE